MTFSSSIVSQFTKINKSISAYNNAVGNSSDASKRFIQRIASGTSSFSNYVKSLNGAKASLGGYITYLGLAEAKTLKLKIASAGLSVILTAGLSLAIGAVTSLITKLANSENEAREAAVNSTQAYKDQQSSLDTQIAKYKELQSHLQTESLTSSQIRDVKSSLLEIQNDLIDSYGDEASRLDLVNGKYSEQLGLLTQISQEEAQKYVSKYQRRYETAYGKLYKEKSVSVALPISQSSTADAITEDEQKVLDYIANYSDKIKLKKTEMTGTEEGSDTITYTLTIKADPQQIDEELSNLSTDIESFIKKGGLDVDTKAITGNISMRNNQMDNEELKENKLIVDNFRFAAVNADSDMSKAYDDITVAVNNYNAALSEGDYTKISEAKKEVDSLRASVAKYKTDDENDVSSVYDDLFAKINTFAETQNKINNVFENNSAVKMYANALKGLYDVDLEAINFDDADLQTGEKEFRGIMDIIGLTNDQAGQLINTLVSLGYVISEVDEQGKDAVGYDISPVVSQLAELQTQYGKLVKIQESIIENNGKISAEDYNTLTSEGLTGYLEEVNGKLTINTEKMLDNADALKANAIMSLKDAMAEDLLNLATYNMKDLSTDAKSAINSMGNGLANLGGKALTAKSAYDLMNQSIQDTHDAINGNLKKNPTYDSAKLAAMQEATIKVYTDKLEELYNTDISSFGKSGSSSGSSSPEDLHKKAFEKELKNLKHLQEMGVINTKEYLSRLRTLYIKYYKARRGYEEEAMQYEAEYFNGMNSLMETIISTVTDRLDEQIDALNKQKDDIEKYYQTQIDAQQELVDGLQKEKDVRDRNKALMEAEYALARAKYQRTDLVYNGEEFVYQADASAVKEAQDAVDEARIEKTVGDLEDSIDSLEKAMKKETKAIDDQIDKLEEYKKLWEKIVPDYENLTKRQMAAEQLGADWEERILNQRMDVLTNFKNDYLKLQQEMKDAALYNVNLNPTSSKYVYNGKEYDTESKYVYNGKEYDTEGDARKAKDEQSGAIMDQIVSLNAKVDQTKASPIPTSAKVSELAYLENKIKSLRSQYLSYKNMPITKAALGGVISPGRSLAQSVGEDTIAYVKYGERILTKEQNYQFEELVHNSKDLNKTISRLEDITNVTNSVNNSSVDKRVVYNNIQVSLPNITNASKATDLARDLENIYQKGQQYFNKN